MKRIICVLTIIIIIIVIILGLHYTNSVTLFKYAENTDGEFICKIIKGATQKKYMNSYIGIFDNKNFIIYIPKQQEKYNFGDIIKITAKYNKPAGQRNYGGFDYLLYLKTKKIYGSFKVSDSKKIYNIYDKSNKKRTIIDDYNLLINKCKNSIKLSLLSNLPKDNANLILGILIGDTNDLSKNIQEDFRNSSLTHLLAVSGDHFSYIMLATSFILVKLKNKRVSQCISVIIIILFMSITGCSPSVVRAGTMALIMILASILHKKIDIWTSLSFSLLIQILFNPYIIFDIGTLLSYGGVIGIVMFYKIFVNLMLTFFKNPKSKLINYIIKAVSITLSANIIIMPIMMYNFNTISFTFVISNILAGIIMSVIVILGFVSVIIKLKPLFFILNILASILAKIAKICSKLPLSSIYITTPNIISIILIYILLIIIYLRKNNINIKIYNIIIGARYRLIVIILIIIIICTNIKVPTFNGMIINFIDVGQGDSTLIRTQNETILIDSGGSTDENFDVGKSTLLPYLLDRKIKKIDYIIVSHFDADHCQGFLYVMQHLKICNAVVGKQIENSNLYEEFIKIATLKKINLIYINNKSNLRLKDVEFQFFSPAEPYIQNNPMNNNAIVCKLIYEKFSMLFTGDIEKEAEENILQKYKNNELNSTILKVAHHGSNTSTTEEFLNMVNPKITLIGVGENNKFGHPNKEVIERIDKKNIKIFRTDKNGEITLFINKEAKVRVNTKIKSNK